MDHGRFCLTSLDFGLWSDCISIFDSQVLWGLPGAQTAPQRPGPHPDSDQMVESFPSNHSDGERKGLWESEAEEVTIWLIWPGASTQEGSGLGGQHSVTSHH